MNDTIYRQAAIDAISCNITVTGKQNAELVAATIGTFADRIKALPPAQLDTIRCKDCYWHGTCKYEQYLGLEGYCSKAEEK